MADTESMAVLRRSRVSPATVYTVGVIMAGLTGYYVSFAVGLLCFVFIGFVTRKVTAAGYIFFILCLGIISFTNYTDWKSGDYDIVRYYDTWSRLAQTDNVEQAALIIYTLRTDHVFYFVTYLLTRIFPADPRWFGFSFTCLTSLLLFLAFRNLCLSNDRKSIIRHPLSLLIFCLGFFAVIRFYDFTNVYRQHLAFAVLLFSITCGWRTWGKVSMAVLAIGLHWSMLATVIPYAVLALLQKKHFKIDQRPIITACIVVGLFGTAVLTTVFAGYENVMRYLTSEELGVDKKLIAILVLTTFVMNRACGAVNIGRNVKMLTFTMTCLSCLFVLQSTVCIRMAFNWTDFLTALSPLMILGYRKTVRPMILVWMLFGFYNLITIDRGNFEYLLFSKYGLMMSVKDIFLTVNPF